MRRPTRPPWRPPCRRLRALRRSAVRRAADVLGVVGAPAPAGVECARVAGSSAGALAFSSPAPVPPAFPGAGGGEGRGRCAGNARARSRPRRRATAGLRSRCCRGRPRGGLRPGRRRDRGCGRDRLGRLLRPEGVVPGLGALLSHPEHRTPCNEGQRRLDQDGPPVPVPQGLVLAHSTDELPGLAQPAQKSVAQRLEHRAHTFPQLPHRHRPKLWEPLLDDCGVLLSPDRRAAPRPRRARTPAATRSPPTRPMRWNWSAVWPLRPTTRTCVRRPAGRSSSAIRRSLVTASGRERSCGRDVADHVECRARGPGARRGAAALPPRSPPPAPHPGRPPSPARASGPPGSRPCAARRLSARGDPRQRKFRQRSDNRSRRVKSARPTGSGAVRALAAGRHRATSRSQNRYITGSSNSVSAHAESVPATMTTASGRCVSLPMPARERRRHEAQRGQRRGHQHRPQAFPAPRRGSPRRAARPAPAARRWPRAPARRSATPGR